MNAKLCIAALPGALLALSNLIGCATPVQDSQVRAQAVPAPVSTNDSACLGGTGTRTAGGSDCAAFKRSYSSEDISRTGASTAADALRLLDPSITITR